MRRETVRLLSRNRTQAISSCDDGAAVRLRGVIRGLILAWGCCTAAPAADFAGPDSTDAAFAKARGIGLVPTAKFFNAEVHAPAGVRMGLLTAGFHDLCRGRAIEKGQSGLRGDPTPRRAD
jgi:hypothetical protein